MWRERDRVCMRASAPARPRPQASSSTSTHAHALPAHPALPPGPASPDPTHHITALQDSEWKRQQKAREEEYAGLEAKRLALQKRIEDCKRGEGLYKNEAWLSHSKTDQMRVFACATKLAAMYRGRKARLEVGHSLGHSPKKGEPGELSAQNQQLNGNRVQSEPADRCYSSAYVGINDVTRVLISA